jgi:protein-S-isoprenylcysteine O-methyltransferase Ste14
MGFSFHIILIPLFWAIWCALHSFLIFPAVTELAQKKLREGFRYYRLFFNIFSLITLLPLGVYSFIYQGEVIFVWTGLWVFLQYGLIGVGLILLWAGGRDYNLSQFLGLHQIQSGQTEQTLSEEGHLDFSGIHKAIRHPWYAAGMLMVWGRDITWSILMTNLVIDVYFVVGAALEEKKLLMAFGEKYKAYQQRVSMLFPYKFLKTIMKIGL